MSEHSQVMEQDAVRDAAPAYRAVSTGAKQDDVPRGYKWTDLGVIPQEWEVKPLKEVAPLQRGFDLPSSQLEEGPYPVVFSNGIWAYHAKPMVRGPGVVTGRSGTLGRVQFITEDYWPHNTTLWVTNFKNNEPLYIYYLYEKLGFERFQSGSGVPTLNRNDAHSYTVIIAPRKTEQRAIAIALSDADALIESLDRLIAKKRAIKQAAMQQLLAGQTRLPGFTGEWRFSTLAEVSALRPGINKPASEMGFGTLYVTVQDLYEGNSIDLSRLGRVRVSVSEVEIGALEAGDIVFGKSSVKRDGIGYPSLFLGHCDPVVCSGFTYRARADTSKILPKFLFYWLRSSPIRRWFIDKSQASALTNINKAIADAVPVALPDLDEQSSIATVLSDMDTEVEALERRRDKARQIKQGMMQQLLTGRVRLVEPETKKPAVC